MVECEPMNNNEISLNIGYVEQALGGDQDPLYPPISISRNGSLAKWRDKLNFIDIRVNDPGLRKYRDSFTEMLTKARGLGKDIVLTLPEFTPVYFDMPPVTERPVEEGEDAPRRPVKKRPAKLVYFKPSYLALPTVIDNRASYQELEIEDYLPVLELAKKFEVRHVVMPVSEPGVFLDPFAEEKFKKKFKALNEFAQANNIQLHLRNGGLALSVFKRMHKIFKCGLAYNVGIASLEGDDMIQTIKEHGDKISVLVLQQILPGLDKWGNRRENMKRALKKYVEAKKEYRQSLAQNGEEGAAELLQEFNYALKEYYDASRNDSFNLGLFQNGHLNLVPLLKDLRRDLKDGVERYFVIEAVPNTKNNDFVMGYLMPESFQSSL